LRPVSLARCLIWQSCVSVIYRCLFFITDKSTECVHEWQLSFFRRNVSGRCD
jgi:hypothetical protein